MQKISKRKRSLITQICEASEGCEYCTTLNELGLLYLFQEFSKASSQLFNFGRYWACQRAWQHIRRKVFSLLLEHWGML